MIVDSRWLERESREGGGGGRETQKVKHETEKLGKQLKRGAAT